MAYLGVENLNLYGWRSVGMMWSHRRVLNCINYSSALTAIFTRELKLPDRHIYMSANMLHYHKVVRAKIFRREREKDFIICHKLKGRSIRLFLCLSTEFRKAIMKCVYLKLKSLEMCYILGFWRKTKTGMIALFANLSFVTSVVALCNIQPLNPLFYGLNLKWAILNVMQHKVTIRWSHYAIRGSEELGDDSWKRLLTR